MSLSDTKRHEFHIGKILPNEQYIACEIDRWSTKPGGLTSSISHVLLWSFSNTSQMWHWLRRSHMCYY